MIKSPCKDCKDRFVGCHSHCEKYKKFRSEWQNENEKIRENKNTLMFKEQYIIDAVNRAKGRKK